MNKQIIKAIEALIELEIIENEPRFEMARAMAISILEKQLTNGWIPCKEMLPEKRREVLVEIKLNGYYSIVIGSYCKIFGKWEIGNDVMGYDWEEEMVDEVIVWQPLPEPYKEVSE